MTDWKKIPKIDAHIHLLPEDVISANQGCGDRFVEYGRAADYMKLMERYNIETAFVMPFNDPYMLSMEFTVEAVHSNLLKMAEEYPARFRFFADVDIRRNIRETLKELDKVLCRDEFIGIKLHPTNAGYPIDGEYYDMIFDYAERGGVLTEIHSYPRAHLNDDVCSPRRIKRVLDKHPALRLSAAHLGGLQFEELSGLNVYVNISAVLPDIVDRLGMERANEILRSFGTDRLVFATDYPDSRSLKPPMIYDRYFELLGAMDLTQEEAENICRYNALRMINGT